MARWLGKFLNVIWLLLGFHKVQVLALLFNIIGKDSQSNILLFANGLKLLIKVNLDHYFVVLQNDTGKIHRWFITNHKPLSLDKSKVIIFS